MANTHTRNTGERKCESVQRCIVVANLSVFNLVNKRKRKKERKKGRKKEKKEKDVSEPTEYY